MTRSFFALACLGLVVGCGNEADVLNATTTTQEQPVTPMGTVSGQVLTTTMAPLADAQVRLTAGASVRTAQTDAEGAFAFGDVPAGSDVLVTVKKDGYAAVHTTTRVPSAAGQFPLAQGNARVGPVVLAALNGSLQLLVVDAAGRPAEGARARVEASPAGMTYYAESMSKTVAEGTVDATGRLSFTALPSPFELVTLGGRYELWVEPLDRDGDGFADLGGRSAEFDPSEIMNNTAPRTIVLPAATSNGGRMAVQAGNAGSFFSRSHPSQNFLAPGESLRLVFNAAIEKNSVLVRLTDEFGREELPATVTVEGGGATLVVKPTQALTQGAEYNVHVRLNAVSGESYTATGFFFVGDRATPKALGISVIRYQETSVELPSRLTPGERVYVEFNQVLSKSATNPVVEAFFSVDINGDNRVGDTVGELGNEWGRGFELVRDEPTEPYASLDEGGSVFPLSKSNYTTRYSFTYTGSVTIDPGLVQITVDFAKLRDRSPDVYETAWGVPATGQLTSGVQGLPPFDR